MSITTVRSVSPACSGAGSATQPVISFLAEEARREHIHHEVLERELRAESSSGAAAWQIESTARELREVEAVEHWLAARLRDLGGAR